MECPACLYACLVLFAYLGSFAVTAKCIYPKEIFGVQVESWKNTGGSQLSNLDPPSSKTFINSLDLPGYPKLEHIRLRLRTYFLAQETGTYIFYLTCDDSCELKLSTDEKRENLVSLVNITRYTDYMRWRRKYSKEVRLSKDLSYFLEAFLTQNAGAHHMTVGVKLPNGSYSRPVSNEYLVKYAPPGAFGDAPMGDWGPWSQCSRTCGVGTQSRNRSCLNPPPVYRKGSTTETRVCQPLKPCYVPCSPPMNLTARNHWSPSKIRVTWKALPAPCWQGITGYFVRLKVKETAHMENKTWSREYFVGPLSRGVPLEGLHTYTTYSLQVAALNGKGLGPYSEAIHVATCRCPRRFLVKWIQSPPLCFQNSKGNPAGMLPKLLPDMITNVCGKCHSHRQTAIIFKEEKHSIRNITSTLSGHTELNLPISMAPNLPFVREEWVFLPMREVEGIAVLMRKPSTADYAAVLGSSVMRRWPVFVIMLALHFLFGLAAWNVERSANPAQFPPRFTRGWSQGWWSAVVSMTTVGYGDSYPITVPGRLLAILSVLVGVVMNVLFVSTLTSSLTVFVVELAVNPETGSKVGFVSGSVEHPLGVRMNGSKGVTSISYPTRDALLQGLKSGALDGALIDVLTLDTFKKDLNDSVFEVAKIIPRKFHYGIILTGDARHLLKDLKEYLRSISITSLPKQQKLIFPAKEEIRPGGTKPTESGKEEVIPFFEPGNVLFQRTVKVTAIALLVSAISGFLYHMIRTMLRGKHERPKSPRQELAAVKMEMRQLLDDFHNRIKQRIFALKIKHRQELLHFREIRKKLSVGTLSYRRNDSSEIEQQV